MHPPSALLFCLCTPLVALTQLLRQAKKPPRAFTMSGFSGMHLHGRYVQSGPLVNGKPAFVKDGSTDYWCCYDAKHQNWKIQPSDAKGTGTGWAYTHEGAVPWDKAAMQWDEYVDGAWVKKSPTISKVEGLEPKKLPSTMNKVGTGRRKAAELKAKKLLARNNNMVASDRHDEPEDAINLASYSVDTYDHMDAPMNAADVFTTHNPVVDDGSHDDGMMMEDDSSSSSSQMAEILKVMKQLQDQHKQDASQHAKDIKQAEEEKTQMMKMFSEKLAEQKTTFEQQIGELKRAQKKEVKKARATVRVSLPGQQPSQWERHIKGVPPPKQKALPNYPGGVKEGYYRIGDAVHETTTQLGGVGQKRKLLPDGYHFIGDPPEKHNVPKVAQPNVPQRPMDRRMKERHEKAEKNRESNARTAEKQNKVNMRERSNKEKAGTGPNSQERLNKSERISKKHRAEKQEKADVKAGKDPKRINHNPNRPPNEPPLLHHKATPGDPSAEKEKGDDEIEFYGDEPPELRTKMEIAKKQHRRGPMRYGPGAGKAFKAKPSIKQAKEQKLKSQETRRKQFKRNSQKFRNVIV